MTRGETAERLFTEGYNCAQAVFLAFEDLYDIDHETALRTASSFGGGMGRMREVCGAVSGMFMAAGALYGYSDPKDADAKKEHYQRIRYFAEQFKAKNGSIICRELLGLEKGENDGGTPSPRTDEYYKKRPCKELCKIAADILDEYIKTM